MVGYQPTEQDLNTTLSIDSMTKDQQRELSQFAALILNQVRSQMGLPLLTVNDAALDITQHEASLVEEAKWHDSNAINQANQYGQDKYGLHGRETLVFVYDRNYNGFSIPSTTAKFTMADIKTLTYYGIVGMLFFPMKDKVLGILLHY